MTVLSHIGVRAALLVGALTLVPADNTALVHDGGGAQEAEAPLPKLNLASMSAPGALVETSYRLPVVEVAPVPGADARERASRPGGGSAAAGSDAPVHHVAGLSPQRVGCPVEVRAIVVEDPEAGDGKPSVFALVVVDDGSAVVRPGASIKVDGQSWVVSSISPHYVILRRGSRHQRCPLPSTR